METVRLLSDSGGIIRNHHLGFCKYTEIHFILLGEIKAINKSWCSASPDYISKSSVQFSSVYCFVIMKYKKTRKSTFFKTKKSKGSHRAYKEWAPSVKLLQQNFNRIIKFFFNRNLPPKKKGHMGKIMICR